MFWNKERHTARERARGGSDRRAGRFVRDEPVSGRDEQALRGPAAGRGEAQGQAGAGLEGASRRASARRAPRSAPVKAAVAVSETVFRHAARARRKEWAGNAGPLRVRHGRRRVVRRVADGGEGRSRRPRLSFGAALWAISDEVAVPALRLSKGPQAYPLRTHAMALASHLVYWRHDRAGAALVAVGRPFQMNQAGSPVAISPRLANDGRAS